jgi:hypothetical protein
MNQQKIDELTAGLAQALALVDEVKNSAYAECGYHETRRYARKVIGNIENLLVVMQAEWAEDERELDDIEDEILKPIRGEQT